MFDIIRDPLWNNITLDDLSLRLGREARVAYVPEARIVHHGGEAARKGPRHVGWFIASAWRFFTRHGWRLA